MKKTFYSGIVALALTAAAFTGVLTAGAGAAHADNVRVAFNIGDVAIGFSDGYWDHHRHWHRWPSNRHRYRYQHTSGVEYHAARHTRWANNGWHDRDDH